MCAKAPAGQELGFAQDPGGQADHTPQQAGNGRAQTGHIRGPAQDEWARAGDASRTGWRHSRTHHKWGQARHVLGPACHVPGPASDGREWEQGQAHHALGWAHQAPADKRATSRETYNDCNGNLPLRGAPMNREDNVSCDPFGQSKEGVFGQSVGKVWNPTKALAWKAELSGCSLTLNPNSSIVWVQLRELEPH
ncbi:uncharacterized protein B0H18DRAFT_957738 [Fomitopsis serialis]|uniref:uncharacterized protein n=1 Tax=Fomitopsis serialis TaxID=139415 RepID=UPI002008CCDA|nr:uncharacterized protein B0H18DRAFT_957738 [Neoantrodia serialis]KAH9918977.1 hypothetical protein B0H18DRAFT_957738 [Neoantrodia serialis]